MLFRVTDVPILCCLPENEDPGLQKRDPRKIAPLFKMIFAATKEISDKGMDHSLLSGITGN
jgi:hypothetical protein